MPTSPFSVFMNSYLMPDQVALGRLVLNMKNPGQNFCPYSALALTTVDISTSEFSSVHALANAESSSQFRASLSKLLSVFASGTDSSVDEIATEKAVSYQLLNTDLAFESLLQDERVKRWLEAALKRAHVYMVVGLHTLRNASVGLNRGGASDVGVHVEVPVSETLAPGMGQALDAMVQGGYSATTTAAASFVAPGERIVAVQYQKVHFRMFSTKTAETTVLERKPRWTLFGAARDVTDIDAIEASLLDITGVADLDGRVRVEAESAAEGEGRGTFVILS